MEIKLSLTMHVTPREGDIIPSEEESRDEIIRILGLDSDRVDDYELSLTMNQHVTKG